MQQQKSSGNLNLRLLAYCWKPAKQRQLFHQARWKGQALCCTDLPTLGQISKRCSKLSCSWEWPYFAQRQVSMEWRRWHCCTDSVAGTELGLLHLTSKISDKSTVNGGVKLQGMSGFFKRSHSNHCEKMCIKLKESNKMHTTSKLVSRCWFSFLGVKQRCGNGRKSPHPTFSL